MSSSEKSSTGNNVELQSNIPTTNNKPQYVPFDLNLNGKSTALDVLKTLQNEKKLASYVNEGGTAIVTGGNSGIGFVSVETLALAGMKVVLCARDVEKAEEKVKTELKLTNS